jgi:hypothetical protein
LFVNEKAFSFSLRNGIVEYVAQAGKIISISIFSDDFTKFDFLLE